MTIRKVPIVGGEYYHLYNRGNSKQKIFLCEEDYKRFSEYLYCCNTYKNFKFRDDIVKKKIDAFDFERGETLVSIGAWVLMPNHFHIYVTISPKSDLWLGIKNNKEEDKISEFMRKLLTAYVKYFNTKYSRTGGLFEAKFKSVHINNDNQAKYLFSYIHLNPIKLIDSKWREEGIQDVVKSLNFLNNYKWSSYLDHRFNIRRESQILNLTDFPNYFSNIRNFDSEILAWLTYNSSPKSDLGLV